MFSPNSHTKACAIEALIICLLFVLSQPVLSICPIAVHRTPDFVATNPIESKECEQIGTTENSVMPSGSIKFSK